MEIEQLIWEELQTSSRCAEMIANEKFPNNREERCGKLVEAADHCCIDARHEISELKMPNQF